jgi:heme A synthase
VHEPSIATVLQTYETTARSPYNHSLATEDNLRFALSDLAAPILRHKRTMLFTFLLVLSATLILGHTTVFPLLPAHTSAVTLLIAILLGLLLGLSLTYLVDYRDPCFHSPVQVIRTLRIPLVVAIPRRTP